MSPCLVPVEYVFLFYCCSIMWLFFIYMWCVFFLYGGGVLFYLDWRSFYLSFIVVLLCGRFLFICGVFFYYVVCVLF